MNDVPLDEKPVSALLRKQIAELVPDLRGFARFLAKNRSEADDLVQEALVRALAHTDQFAPGTHLRSWLFAILRNTFYEQVRRKRRERRAMEDAGVEARQGPAGHDERATLNDLEIRLQGLTPVLREALVLVGAQELSYEEAAGICGVPVGTMKARVSRARLQLRRMLAAAGG